MGFGVVTRLSYFVLGSALLEADSPQALAPAGQATTWCATVRRRLQSRARFTSTAEGASGLSEPEHRADKKHDRVADEPKVKLSTMSVSGQGSITGTMNQKSFMEQNTTAHLKLKPAGDDADITIEAPYVKCTFRATAMKGSSDCRSSGASCGKYTLSGGSIAIKSTAA